MRSLVSFKGTAIEFNKFLTSLKGKFLFTAKLSEFKNIIIYSVN